MMMCEGRAREKKKMMCEGRESYGGERSTWGVGGVVD